MGKPSKKRRKREKTLEYAPVVLEVDREYETYGGDIVRVMKDEGDGIFTCEFVRTCPQRDDLLGKTSQWTVKGKWLVMPHCIMDLDWEIARI